MRWSNLPAASSRRTASPQPPGGPAVAAAQAERHKMPVTQNQPFCGPARHELVIEQAVHTRHAWNLLRPGQPGQSRSVTSWPAVKAARGRLANNERRR